MQDFLPLVVLILISVAFIAYNSRSRQQTELNKNEKTNEWKTIKSKRIPVFKPSDPKVIRWLDEKEMLVNNKKMHPWLKAHGKMCLDALSKRKEKGDYYDKFKNADFKGSNIERLATIYRIAGDTKKAGKLYKEASAEYWPYYDLAPDGEWSKMDSFTYIRDGGYNQIKAAICSFLAGEKNKHIQLFEWACKNIDLPKEAIDFWRPGSLGEHPNLSARLLLRQAYVEARLWQFDIAVEKAADAKEITAYFINKEDQNVEIEWLLQSNVLINLAAYKLNPSQENKSNAQDALEAYMKACPKNMKGIDNYLYIFDLQKAFPDVFDPVFPS